jgi:hypothetical protein
MTVVVGWKANPFERASAYPVVRALDTMGRLCREAELGGARHVLVDVVGLIFDPGGLGFRNIRTGTITERVLEAVRHGELLLVPGWDWMGRNPATRGRWDATARRGIAVPDGHQASVLTVLGTHQNGVFVVDGRRYRVVTADGLGATDGLGRSNHEVVDPAEAALLLQKMADQSLGAPAVALAFKDASRLVGKAGSDRGGRSVSSLAEIRVNLDRMPTA